jgi:crossover junction endodeoxyribonuclease RuvC
VRILGIDPGLRVTGYGAIDTAGRTPRLLGAGVIRLDARQGMSQRLEELESELMAVYDEFMPQACAVEQLYAHYAHPRTAILMGHARGVILLCARKRGIRLLEVAANRVKQSVTGHGHASKHQVQQAIQGLFGLASPPRPADVADALAIAVCGARGLQAGRSAHPRRVAS